MDATELQEPWGRYIHLPTTSNISPLSLSGSLRISSEGDQEPTRIYMDHTSNETVPPLRFSCLGRLGGSSRVPDKSARGYSRGSPDSYGRAGGSSRCQGDILLSDKLGCGRVAVMMYGLCHVRL